MTSLQLCRNLTGELTHCRIWQTKEEHCDWFKSWASNWWNVHSFPVLQASGIKSSNYTIYSIFILGGGLPLLLWCVTFVKTAWLHSHEGHSWKATSIPHLLWACAGHWRRYESTLDLMMVFWKLSYPFPSPLHMFLFLMKIVRL